MSNSPSLAIIIPSFNESKNLSVLIPNILLIKPDAMIIVVDDSIGIEKAHTEKAIQKFRTHVVYIKRDGKSGRGSAVIDGMKHALSIRSIQVCIEMDADLAHDPKEIPSLLKKIRTADMVIGSRYIKGSGIVKWPLSRLIQSRIINIFLRYWLGLRISDYTNGFRAYTRRACEYITSIRLREKGFISLSEVAYRLKQKGFLIAEVPITFTDRKFGKSNANLRELITSLVGAIRMRFSR